THRDLHAFPTRRSSDLERAERVAQVLKEVDLEPLLVDHAALMRTILQSPTTPPALLIGDPGDCDWVELGAALREQLGDVPVVARSEEHTSELQSREKLV